jgi:hypothetical protein
MRFVMKREKSVRYLTAALHVFTVVCVSVFHVLTNDKITSIM